MVQWWASTRKTTLLRNYRRFWSIRPAVISATTVPTSVGCTSRRKVGFVFQHYALTTHMTVFDNIAFGLTVLPHERPNAAAI